MENSEKFKFLEHTADIKLRANGNSVEEVFENVALGVSSYLSRGEEVNSEIEKSINVSGSDFHELLCNFVDELIYLLDAENFLVCKARVNVKDLKLSGKVYGSDSKKYSVDFIKAATYSEIEFEKNKDGWTAQIVLDV